MDRVVGILKQHLFFVPAGNCYSEVFPTLVGNAHSRESSAGHGGSSRVGERG